MVSTIHYQVHLAQLDALVLLGSTARGALRQVPIDTIPMFLPGRHGNNYDRRWKGGLTPLSPDTG